MSVILAPNGLDFAAQRTVPMTAAQVGWFVSAPVFLEAVPHLWTLKLALVCGHCRRDGAADAVKVVYNETTDTWFVRCQCQPIAGRLPRAEIAQLETTELLHKLGWSLRCTDCEQYASGENDPGRATTLCVTCACTKRVHHLPAAPLVARPS